MSTGKKWLVRFFLLVFIALVTMGLWLPPIITHAVEKDYHFPEVDIDATVLPNGDLMLEETRTFDFQNGPFTYAYFNVDDPLDHVRDFTIAEKLDDGTEVPVTPDYASHSIVTEGFQSQWSYSAEDETRTWVFRYRVACAVDVYSDTAHLYWQFIGSGWDQPTQHAVITVHLPGHSASDARRPRACHPDEGVILDVGQTPLTRGEVRAFGHGPLNGEVTFVNPQTIRYDVHDVPPLSYVEGSILFPADAVPTAVATDQPGLERILDQERVWADEANALRERHETERDWVLYLLIGVPVALALLVLLARYRDRVPGVPKILEQPPEEDPVQGSVLWSAWAGHLSPQNAYRAQLLKLARLGAIEMKADGLVTDPKDLTLVRKMDAMDLQTELDQDFMWLLFGRGEDAVDEVSVNHPKPRKAESSGTYAAWWSGVKMKSDRHHPSDPQGRRPPRVDPGGDHRDRRGRLRHLDGRLGSRRRDRLVARPGRGDQPDRGADQDPRAARARGPDAHQAARGVPDLPQGLLRPAERPRARRRHLGAVPGVGGRARGRGRGREAGQGARARREPPIADPGRAHRPGGADGVAALPVGGARARPGLDGQREQRVLERRVRLVELVQRVLGRRVLRRRRRGRRRHGRGRRLRALPVW